MQIISSSELRSRQPAQGCTKGHDFLSARFAGFGSFVARHTLLVFAGSLVVVAFCFGIFNYDSEQSFDVLWVREGDRTARESYTFNSFFGGFPRRQVVSLTSASGPFTSETNLNALKAQISRILVESDTTNPSVTPTGQISIASFIGAVGSSPKTYTNKDFCDAPSVPSYLQYSASTPNVAKAYQQLTSCLNTYARAPNPESDAGQQH